MARFPMLRRLKNVKGVHETGEILDKLTPRPQDIAGGLFHNAMYSAWTGARNAFRGVRGRAETLNFLTQEKEMMSPARQLVNDIRKKGKQFRAGYEMEFDAAAGRFVPKMERDGDNMVPIRVSRREMAGKIASDAIVGGSAMALGWGAKTAAGTAAWAAAKSVRPLGHATYQAAGLARDLGITAAHDLHALSQSKIGAWGLAIAPLGIMAGAEAMDYGEHYAVNKGLRGYEGQQLDSAFGSITDSQISLAAAGRREKKTQITRNSGQVLDTFGTGGDLVFSMHNQR